MKTNSTIQDRWASNEARDLIQIAVRFGGFDALEVFRELPACFVQVRHVERALSIIRKRRG